MRNIMMMTAFALATQISVAAAQDCKTEVVTITPGKLVVAGYDYPPFSQTNPDGSLSGIDFDVVRAVADENCLEVVPMAVDPSAAVQAVVSGKADVAIGGWNRTEKRVDVLGMSAPTYLDPSAIFSKDGIDTIAGLEGKTVGTVSGYLFVPDLQALLGANLKLYPNGVALAQDLAAGRIDAAVDGYTYGVYSQKNAGAYEDIQIKIPAADERVGSTVRPPQAAVLYTKGNESLGKALDTGIDRLHKDGKLTAAVTAAGFDASLADTGEPYFVK
ncbi:transporter substrate-binding domain-containing protein [Shinella daejeonensis]|uniref:substrate-binding periplasmic protein n=1 Tax=Shinella daejeonensis TaxID=659017 RepID=UPI0020C74EDF|nr:transporter substrate-binding domain-containing protein [Shinella daejeonensis]MCP8897468.1 transporter substrate-binding domain-containing protein [Shinella daejeonensis]